MGLLEVGEDLVVGLGEASCDIFHYSDPSYFSVPVLFCRKIYVLSEPLSKVDILHIIETLFAFPNEIDKNFSILVKIHYYIALY